MAPKRNGMVLSLVLVVMMWQGAWAQSNCVNAIMSLTPCSNYITGSSLGPSTSCCSQLNGVIKNQPECMCSFINGGGASLGIVVSQTTALALPGACSLDSSPLGQCNVASGQTASAASPASAPMESQSPGSIPSDNSNPGDTPQVSTPLTPSQTTTPSSTGAGSKTVPSTNNTSSGAIINKSPFSVAMILILAMSFSLSNSGF